MQPHGDALLVRPARPSDIPALAGLRFHWRSVERSERGLDADSFASAFIDWVQGRPSHLGFLALRGDTPVGMAWLAIVDRVPGPELFHRRSGSIQSVYVLPDARGGGVATTLVEHCVAAARERGLEYLTLHYSEPSEPLYRRLDFTEPVRCLELRL